MVDTFQRLRWPKEEAMGYKRIVTLNFKERK